MASSTACGSTVAASEARGYPRSMLVCLAANPSIDKLFEIDRLVRGDIHRPAGFVQTAGGKGLNVARAAHALGADVRVAGILRGHAGTWIKEQLGAEGVRGTFVWCHGENRSSLSVADRETASLTEFYEHGSVVPSATWAELLAEVDALLPAASWLTISGSLPRGAPDDGYRDLVRDARAAGVRVALDADGERLRLAIDGQPDVVKVNQAEAAGLLGVPTSRRDEALAAADKLRTLAGGDGHAGIVTRGADGVVVAAPDGTRYEGRLYVRHRYPVGSGDAFLAGLVSALLHDEDWPDALRKALGAATANAALAGAGRLDPVHAELLAADADVRIV
jgi:1-phosphofructokinase family hexose kinase